MAGKIIGRQQAQLDKLYLLAKHRRETRVVFDSTHPLNSESVMLPSGRSYKVPKYLRNVYKHSFIPVAIRIINEG